MKCANLILPIDLGKDLNRLDEDVTAYQQWLKQAISHTRVHW